VCLPAKFFEFCYLCAVGKGKCVKIRYEPYTKPLGKIFWHPKGKEKRAERQKASKEYRTQRNMEE